MNRLHLALLAGTVACSSLALAQAPDQESAPGTQNPAPATSPTEGTAADRTPPGATPTSPQQTPDAVNPAPSTSETEGTAADNTPPGATAGSTGTSTPSDASTNAGQSASTRPTDSSATAGSSADAESTRMAAAGTMGSKSASQLIGATVQGMQGETVGTVQDVMIDSNGSVSAVVITPSGSTTSPQRATVPWDAIRSAAADGKLVVDSSRVQSERSQ
jgi:sporulation protein YlmC with PRC-barrel domain